MLLTPRALARLVSEAVRRRQAADRLLTVADRVERADIAPMPMPMQEIDAEVKAVRASRKRRAGSGAGRRTN
jgi:hypothetical protein